MSNAQIGCKSPTDSPEEPKILSSRFPYYGKTLQAADAEPVASFTDVEQEAHSTDHGLMGALMARSWGVSQTVCLAIRLHHNYVVFNDPKVPTTVARLIAMGLLAERAIQAFARLHSSTEWDKGGDGAIGALMLSDQDIDEWMERLAGGFSEGGRISRSNALFRGAGAAIGSPGPSVEALMDDQISHVVGRRCRPALQSDQAGGHFHLKIKGLPS